MPSPLEKKGRGVESTARQEELQANGTALPLHLAYQVVGLARDAHLLVGGDGADLDGAI